MPYSLIIIIHIYIIEEEPHQAAFKSAVSLEGQEKRKDRKTRKIGGKREWWVLASLPARKREAVTQSGTREMEHPTRRKTQGTGIVMAGRTGETEGAFLIHSRTTRITRARAP